MSRLMPSTALNVPKLLVRSSHWIMALTFHS
jgi:hypothetical protein